MLSCVDTVVRDKSKTWVEDYKMRLKLVCFDKLNLFTWNFKHSTNYPIFHQSPSLIFSLALLIDITDKERKRKIDFFYIFHCSLKCCQKYESVQLERIMSNNSHLCCRKNLHGAFAIDVENISYSLLWIDFYSVVFLCRWAPRTNKDFGLTVFDTRLESI